MKKEKGDGTLSIQSSLHFQGNLSQSHRVDLQGQRIRHTGVPFQLAQTHGASLA